MQCERKICQSKDLKKRHRAFLKLSAAYYITLKDVNASKTTSIKSERDI